MMRLYPYCLVLFVAALSSHACRSTKGKQKVEISPTTPGARNSPPGVVEERFDAEFLSNLPLQSRASIQGVLSNQFAGAVSGSPAVSGGSSSDSVFQLDAFEIRDANGGRGLGRESLAPSFNTEAYDQVVHNPFASPRTQPLATFSIDVDTAAYANVRRFLQNGHLPPRGAVRIEEMINYFHYEYPSPRQGEVIAADLEAKACPWNDEARLVRIGLRAKDVPLNDIPQANLVFLVDVSGSMAEANKLPLVKRSLHILVENLRRDDRIAIVTYAGTAGVALPSTPVMRKAQIRAAIEDLGAGGATNGAQGIGRAYQIARENFIHHGNNRVILATDGDFNVGVTSRDDLISLIEREAREGIFLTVLGYGMGNYKDATLEQLADRGDGNYAYVDGVDEARRVLGDRVLGTLLTVARDVKLQVEFNPAKVGAYRLIGYDNRLLRREDFNDDRMDAGELGAGHTVTALFEVLPPGAAAERVLNGRSVDALKYARPAAGERSAGSTSRETLTVKVRYKAPDGGASERREWTLLDAAPVATGASDRFGLAAAVAAFAMTLRKDPNRGAADYHLAAALARATRAGDPADRAELLSLIEAARELDGRQLSPRP